MWVDDLLRNETWGARLVIMKFMGGRVMASLVGCLCCSTSSSKFDGKLFRSLCINMLLGCLRHLAAMTMDVMLINSTQLCWNRALKETHTICFSSSLYIINQKPMIPRTHFHCMTTWVAPSSGGKFGHAFACFVVSVY